MPSSSSSYLMIAFPTTCLKLDTLLSLNQPLLPPPQSGNPPDKYKALCESALKRKLLFLFKSGGVRGGGEGLWCRSLDGGCHGFFSKASGYNGTSHFWCQRLRNSGEGKSLVRGRDEGKGKGKEGRKEGGDMGGRGGSLLLMIIK